MAFGQPGQSGTQPPAQRISAADVHSVAFGKPPFGKRGYDEDEVDAFLDLVEGELRWRASAEGRRELSVAAAAPVQASRVRAVAVAVLADRGRMLATENVDPDTGRTVYRPPGADIAFGERGHETVARAFREEFGAGLLDIRPLATLESIHRFGGREGHELVLVYEATPADPAIWAQQRLIGRRGGLTTSAVWVPTEAFRRGEAVLLPDGLVDLLGSLPGG